MKIINQKVEKTLDYFSNRVKLISRMKTFIRKEDIDRIQPGQKWQAAGGSVVTVEKIRPISFIWENNVIDYAVVYSWDDNGQKKSHEKLLYAFQCRYVQI